MKVRFLEVAEMELGDAIKYYDEAAPEVGSAFRQAISTGVHKILKYPDGRKLILPFGATD